MQKKILTSIIIICLLGIVLFIFLFLKKESQVFNKSIYQAIPKNSALFFEIKNYKTFTSHTQEHNEIWKTLSAFNVISQYNSFIADIDSTLSRNQDFDILADNSIIISVQQIGKNKLEFLFLIPIQNEKEIDVAHEFMRTKYRTDSTTEFVYNNLYPITSFVS
ncbi:MAG: hypothetical protein ACOCWB_08255, partial [Bacteroidota bacterium]